MKGARLFGQRIRAVRTALRLRQEQVADRAGIDAKHLGRIERGEKNPSFELIFDLAKAMNVAPLTFFEFDRDESDPAVLRKKIEALVGKCNPQQLQQAHRLLKSLLEP